jgi:hypothetical protein
MVTDFGWGDSFKFVQRCQYEVKNERLLLVVRIPLILPLLEAISRFTGLKVLYLTWTFKFKEIRQSDDRSALDDHRKTMQEFVERYRHDFEESEAPEVQARLWDPATILEEA